MSPAAKRWILSGGAVAVIAIVVAALLMLRGGSGAPAPASATSDEDAGSVVTRYLQAWSQGRDPEAGALTDDPAKAVAEFQAIRASLRPTALAATLRQVTGQSALVGVRWTFGSARVWSYETKLALVSGAGGWRVHFTPASVHPELGAGDTLVMRGASGGTAAVDRDGKPLLTWQSDGPKATDPAVAPLLVPGIGRLLGPGAAAWSVSRVDSAGKEHELYHEGQVRGAPETTSLSITAQNAAQAAVDAQSTPAMLVAIQPSTGDVLAVARNSAATDGNPLSGLYAPGSTFKIATAAAVLEQGLAEANTALPCPGTAQIGQRTIPNDDQFSFASLPLHSAFAHSCNTTFAQLASQLPADGLAKAASQFGLNADFDIPGITTEAGKVTAATSPAELVESAIGQGTVQASPFGLTLMAATVAAGKPVTPQLMRAHPTKVGTGYQAPPGGVITTLRSMMREVVTGGTATGLQGSGQVYGKTGTAQFGDGTHANGWFAGYRGDVAFSVLLLGSDSSKPAVSAAAAFLGRL
ncbi:MAG TPA: penicillin-binding transpeptidase domain-containing protein [Amycolatopsis sp.]|nr:penicillin-binding transpeptidase domain-containing protein [Amycolatopsis sp.]